MAVNIQGNQIVSTASKPSIDADYGPYTGSTLQEALNSAESALKYKKSEGKTIGIKVGTNSIIEYWYKFNNNNELSLTEKTPDLSSKQDIITNSNKLDADLVDDANSDNKFVTSSEKTIWNGKQNALTTEQLSNITKGGTALQPSSTSGLLKNDGTVDTETQSKAANAIQTPSATENGKIPVMRNGSIEWEAKPSNGQDGAQGPKGDPGHNPCLGRLNVVPADFDIAFPDAIAGDYVYVDIYDSTTQTTTTTIYHYVDDTNGWDSGTVIDAEHPTFASSQPVTAVHIKDENGEEVTGPADVLSAEAGKNIGDAVFGEKNKVTTIIQPTSVTTSAFLAKGSSDEGEGNVQITNGASSYPNMRTAFYPIVQGRKYTIDIPLTGNQNMGTHAYTFNVAPEPLTNTTYILPGYHFTNVGNGRSQQIVIESAMSYTYLAVTYSTANDAGAPTVTEEYETIVSPGLNEKVETLQEDIEALDKDVDETIYENEGQVDYYDENGITTKWAGTGTSTPALSSDVIINKVIFPPFKNITAGNYTCKYLVGYRVYSASFIPRTNLTILAEGSIENVSNSFIRNFYIELESPTTIPAGNQLIVLLYIPNGKACILGGGNDATEVLPYNSEDAVALATTSVTDTPFDVTWYKSNPSDTALYKVCNPILRFDKKSEVRRIAEEAVEEVVPKVVPNLVDEHILENDKVNVYLPNKLYAVVGDTLQLFFQSIVGVINIADYDIYAECSKGKTFPRYFSYTPTVEDVGTTTLTIYVKDRNNNILGQASCDIVTVSAPTSPASEKSIFTFGDSLTSGGKWAGEAKRRLVGNTTYDSITGKGLSNISFFGYKNETINGQSVDYFGVGGWTWTNYLLKLTGGAFRFYVEGVNQLHIGDTYTNNGHTYTIQEINVTGDSGNIRCTTSSTTNTPSASGTLTKTSGDGDTTIAFGSVDTENTNPLWDDANNKMSFVPYVQNCGASTIDAVYVLLSWNGQAAWKEYSVNDATGHIANAKTFARTLHTEYPNAKLFIMGIQMPSDTGGLGYGYGASGGYIDGYGLKQCALNYNKALQDLCNLDEFSSYCEFVAVAPQFDSHYNMPYYNTNVNTRSTVKEMLGSNGVHPSDGGYFQIADAVYRSIVANFCQGV